MDTYVVGITGASGAPYAIRILRAILERGDHVKLVVSPAGERVLAIELGVSLSGGRKARQEQWRELLGYDGEQFELLAHRDFSASIASGSYYFKAMVVVPCSMGTLSRIATGASTNLIERAADVSLKEKRTLVLVPRETPLNKIHLKNMLAVADAGAEVLPATPGFYNHPKTLDDLIDMLASRVLDRLGVDNELTKRWQGDPLGNYARPLE